MHIINNVVMMDDQPYSEKVTISSKNKIFYTLTRMCKRGIQMHIINSVAMMDINPTVRK